MIKITNGRPNLYAVLKNPPTKIPLNKPKIKQAIPNAKGFAFISALFRYTMDCEKTVIRRTTAAAISIIAQPSIRQTNRYFPFTTSRFAIGRSAENTISFASLAFWKLWNKPRLTKNALHRTGYPGRKNISPNRVNR